MSNFKFLKNPITSNYLDLKESIFGPDICWLYQSRQTDYKVNSSSDYCSSVPLFYHNVLERPESVEQGTSFDDIDCRIRSGVYDRIKTVIEEIFDANNIKVKKYHRISVNCCLNVNTHVQSPVHVDHLFEHQQMIIYLSTSLAPTNPYAEKYTSGYDVNKSSYYLGLEKKDILLKIYPHEDQIVTFDGLYYHSYDYPTTDKQRRIVIVCTYS